MVLITVTIYAAAATMYIFLMFVTAGWFSFVSPTVVQSAGFVINFINKTFILPGPLAHTFDYVVDTELGLDRRRPTLERGVLDNSLQGYYGETTLGKGVRTAKKVAYPGWWLVREAILFVIDLIPLAGPVLVILLRSARAGFKKHKRYFYLKGYSSARINYVWCCKRAQYLVFGLVTQTLEMIPFVNILFFYTNTIGAALWAVDVEKEMAAATASVAKTASPITMKQESS